MRRCLTAAALAVLVLALGACGGDDSPEVSKDTATTTAEAPTGTKGSTITIKDFAFAPSPLEAAPGATITVSNSDSTAHTVTADDKGFDTGSVDGGSTKTFTAPSDPGTYSFHCNIHSTMKGSIRVSG